MLPVDNARQGFLDPADLEALVAALPTWIQPPARFAYLTGWRKADIFGLQLADITHEPDGALVIQLRARSTKERQSRRLPLRPDTSLHELVTAQEDAADRVGSSFLFHHPDGRQIRSHYSAWRRAAKAIGRPGLTLHDFRRSASRNMRRAGFDEATAMSVTGHKTRAMFDRYAIVDDRDVAEALVGVADYVANTAATTTPKVRPLRKRTEVPGPMHGEAGDSYSRGYSRRRTRRAR